ncbi:MAG: regulatory protein RecX [Deltaproteobacteria bacterium]|nr:regulatory protein RecX [Deltaproteobacteria bacterium]
MTDADTDAALAKAMRKAYRLLALRARSEKELRDKLKEKGFAESVLNKVIIKLADFKYLDDASFAGQWARNLAVNKLHGNRRIRISLREKGIPDVMIEKAIDEARDELSEQAAIEKLIKKRIDRRKIVEMDSREKHRLYQWLTGKGFASEMIYKKIKDL